MMGLARAEWLKLRSTKTPYVIIISVLVCVAVPVVVFIAWLPADLLETDGMGSAIGTFSALVPLALLALGITGMTSEYRHGTITYAYLVAPRRWQLMTVKLAVYAAVGLVTMVGTVLVVMAIIKAGGAVRGISIDPTSGATVWDYVRQVVTAGLITAFGVALGALFKSHVVVTITVTLIWALLVENIISVLKPSVGMWLPFVVFNQVSAVVPENMGSAQDSLSRPEAFLVSLAYIAVVSLLAVFISLRRDVT